METKKRIRLLLAALLSLSGVLPAAATDYQESDHLPLAVGNSWTYEHYHSDHNHHRSQWSAYVAQFPETPQFTIRVERTEVIDGKTYYVISDMPANWPPAPPLFIAGKKLRWKGTHLMQRTSDGEQAIFRFDGTNKTGYEITTDEGDIQISVEERVSSRYPVPKYAFEYLEFAERGAEGGGGSRFLAGYGLELCVRVIVEIDVTSFINEVKAVRAVLGGRRVEYADARISTSLSSSSWGQVKQSLSFYATEGRNSQ